jgi:hypothetical protein
MLKKWVTFSELRDLRRLTPRTELTLRRTTKPTPDLDGTMAQSDEEDDYMNMVFEDTPKDPKYENSIQRAARKRKEVGLFLKH